MWHQLGILHLVICSKLRFQRVGRVNSLSPIVTCCHLKVENQYYHRFFCIVFYLCSSFPVVQAYIKDNNSTALLNLFINVHYKGWTSYYILCFWLLWFWSMIFVFWLAVARYSLVVECLLRVREVQVLIPDRGRIIPKPLKKWYQWFPCLALKIKRETLVFSKFSKSSNSKFIANIPTLRTLWEIDYVK